MKTNDRHEPFAWMRRVLVGLALMAACACAPAQEVHESRAGYDYYAIGNLAGNAPATTSPGLLLMGGGREIDAAFKWFVKQAGHGHIVILAASGKDELQEWIHHDIGGVRSIQTLVFHARAPASDPRILEIIRHADGIFIKGGDQSNYVRFWKGTPLNALLDQHVRDGRPLGGTSAGLAILGEWGYGAMDGGSITSREALADPDGPAVTLVGHFMSLPLLKGTITDTHFTQRERLGRLLAFVARTAKDQHTAAVTGLGVDQDSALLVDADGNARFLSWHADGHAWVVIPQRLRDVERGGGAAGLEAYLKSRVAPGRPLDVPGFVVIGIGTDSRLHLPDYAVTRPDFTRHIDVIRGRMETRAPAAAEPVTSARRGGSARAVLP